VAREKKKKKEKGKKNGSVRERASQNTSYIGLEEGDCAYIHWLAALPRLAHQAQFENTCVCGSPEECKRAVLRRWVPPEYTCSETGPSTFLWPPAFTCLLNLALAHSYPSP
jgi:hypothetical protein